INEKGKKMGAVSTAHVDRDNVLFELYASQCIHGCTLLIPKAAFDKAGNFRQDLPTTQDYDLWLRMARFFRFFHIPGIFVYSRQHAEQGSRTLGHNREVLNFYMTNMGLLTPEWLDRHYPPQQVYAI